MCQPEKPIDFEIILYSSQALINAGKRIDSLVRQNGSVWNVSVAVLKAFNTAKPLNANQDDKQIDVCICAKHA